MTTFDKTKSYKEHIQPIVEQLKMRCEAHDIPMFVTCCVKSTEEETKYIREGVCTGSKKYQLADDQIEKHLLVANGFKVSPPGFCEELPDNFLEYIAENEVDIVNSEEPQEVDDYPDIEE